MPMFRIWIDMVTITNNRNIKYLKCDENWAIVRRMRRSIKNISQVYELSPSNETFRMYLNLKSMGECTLIDEKRLMKKQHVLNIAIKNASIKLRNMAMAIETIGNAFKENPKNGNRIDG